MVLIFDWSRASLLICVWSQHGVRLRDRRHWLPRESLWLRCQRPSYSLPCDSPLRRHWLPRAFPPRHSLPCESLLRLLRIALAAALVISPLPLAAGRIALALAQLRVSPRPLECA